MNHTVLPSEGLSDRILAQNILDGEQRVFEQIIRRYNTRLYRLGMVILHDGMEVEDAMQVTYINAFRHLADFERRSSLGTWITRIMLNECLARKNKRQRLKITEDMNHQNFTTMNTPASLLINKELRGTLETAIAQLPEKYRMVFVLREVEDLSVRETADVLSLNETNIKVRLNRAKTMLRDNLQGYMKEHVYLFHLTRCNRIVDQVFKALQIERP